MDAIIKTLLAQITQRGNRERDRREEWERSLKPTQYKGNNLFQEMGGNPIAGRYLGQSGLIPGQFVPNIGRNPNKPVIPGLPIPVETIEEEPVFIPKTPYLVGLEPLIVSSSNQGYRITYYRGNQEIILGDFRVSRVPVSGSAISWVYENKAKPKWKDWVIWVRVGDYGRIQLPDETPGLTPTPAGILWRAQQRETTIGIKGSGNTVIESRIYVRRIDQLDNLNVYASAIGEGPLSYALFNSANYETTVITPEDFLDTYDADNPINDFRNDRLQWHPVDLENAPGAALPFPYPSTVNVINANLLEVVSESTGRWIKFPLVNESTGRFPRVDTIYTTYIIGGTTQ